MSERKSLLIILPSFAIGGMQRVATLIANELVTQDVDVILYSIGKSKNHFFKLDVRVSLIEPTQKVKSSFFFKRYFNYLKNINYAYNNCFPDKILVFGKIQSALTLLTLWEKRKRIYISDRASVVQRDPFLIYYFTKAIFKIIKPAGIIAQTTESALLQKKIFGKQQRIKVIPNPVKEIKTYNTDKENIVLAVGRLGDHLKGFDRLIDAWALVTEPHWKLVIAGGNETDDPALTNKIKELNIHNKVHFIGKVEDIDKVYAKSAIFVIPSRSEGFPNALAEAMCAGLACISFDFLSGPRDMIINNENGIIVKNNDIVQLGKEISNLINDQKRRIQLGTRAISLKNELDIKLIAKKYFNFIFNEQ